jgi:geranylgeranyl diphosphate synthase type II
MNNLNKQHNLSESLIQYYRDSTKDFQPNGNHDEVYSSFYYVLSMKSKKVRPLLLLHANQLFDGHLEEAIPAAITVELFHNFTLVHDDIMDNAPIRRGIPTVHVKYGLGTAINTGDLLMIMAYTHLTKINSVYLSEVFALYNHMSTKIMEGQSLDLKFEEYDTVRTEDYLIMIELKTSLLIAFSLKLGALLAGASANDQHLMSELGRNIGLCFQLRDDWLDVYGDAITGKKIGGDIVANKKTFLYIKAWQLADDEQKQELIRLKELENEQIKIEETIQIYNDLQIGELTEKLIDNYYTAAIECLNALSVSNKKKQPLNELIQGIYLREF